jgi:hypothetical protein
VDTTDAVDLAVAEVERGRGPVLGAGVILGLFGYLLALVGFGYVGLFTGGADAGDQLGSGGSNDGGCGVSQPRR